MDFIWTILAVALLGVVILGMNINGEHENPLKTLNDIFDNQINWLHDLIFAKDKKENLEDSLMPEQKDKVWKSFVAARALYRDAKETHSKNLEYLQKLESDLISTERALQDPVRGFYMGASKDLMNLKLGEFPLYLKWGNLDNHYIFFGTTRFGKSHAMANHLRQFINQNQNIFLFDFKGGDKHEILAWGIEFADEAKRLGEVFFFNPAFTELSDKFNPCFGKTNSEIASELLIYGKGKGVETKEDFFLEQIYKVIIAITTALEYLEKSWDPYGEKTKLLIEDEIRRYFLDRVTNGYDVKFNKNDRTMSPDLARRSSKPAYQIPYAETSLYNRSLLTFKDLAHYVLYDNLGTLFKTVSGTPVPILNDATKTSELKLLRDEAVSLLSAAYSSSKDYYENTTGNLTLLLTRLSTGNIGKMFCSTKINPLAIQMHDPDKGVIAIIQPVPFKYQKISDIITKIFLNMFKTTLGDISASGRGLARRSVVMIDEASKAMDRDIGEILKMGGGLGMTMGFYMQSMAQMIEELGQASTSSILDNINTVAYLKTNDNRSKKEASENFGTRKRADYQMMGAGGIGSAGMSRLGVTTVLESLASPDAFDQLEVGEALISHYGKKYITKLPHQPKPKGYLIMPQTDKERIEKEALRFLKEMEEDMLAA
ncbi:MAG: TraM recognition domain-containing protein [Campylobacterales bacterium]|nr:TraM recognition domain-containing protein [Campylobacterales bacterium]